MSAIVKSRAPTAPGEPPDAREDSHEQRDGERLAARAKRREQTCSPEARRRMPRLRLAPTGYAGGDLRLASGRLASGELREHTLYAEPECAERC